MKNTLSILFISILVLMLSCKSGKQPAMDETSDKDTLATKPSKELKFRKYNNILTDREEAEGWRLLFHGDSLGGWHNYGGSGVEGWEIANGKLVCLGNSTIDKSYDIVTDKIYGDFELTLEYNLSPGANSGIFFNVVEEGYDGAYETAPEYQVLDDLHEKNQNKKAVHKTAANYDLQAPAESKTVFPAGEWNRAKIKVQEGHVEHWLNDELVLEYELWTPEWEEKVSNSKFKDFPAYGESRKGRIGLQDHGAKVKFRNIFIREL